MTLSLLITQILDVDEKNQLIAVECWLKQVTKSICDRLLKFELDIKEWRDVNLQWNPKQYKNVDQIHVPHEWIWKVNQIELIRRSFQCQSRQVVSIVDKVVWGIRQIR